ncbi:MAG: hypothetical protein WBF84_03915 [Castellaniella sp.]|uniref:hypothetical protein n=1 Tax=Castellaniella sp. TaxID=1955812 RepID=UPI003C7087DC
MKIMVFLMKMSNEHQFSSAHKRNERQKRIQSKLLASLTVGTVAAYRQKAAHFLIG